jgi:cellulose synthase/poly-beta-1,6-N-acetylglucosamine synthase-like glycosyltransferase
MNYPLVTAITLIYNTNPKYVIEAIQSIRANNYPNIQHIIIDDCSPDPEPKRVVKQWVEDNDYLCEFYEHEVNYGVTKTLNHAIALTKGKYFFGCSDDLIVRDRIETEVTLLESLGDEYAATYSDAFLIDENSLPIYGLFIQKYRQFTKLPDHDLFEVLLDGNFLPAMSMMWRTDYVREVGGYDEYVPVEDYNLNLRLARKYKIKLIHTPVAKYRIHSESLSNHLPDWDGILYKTLLKHNDHAKVRQIIKDIRLRKLANANTLKELKDVGIKFYFFWFIMNRLIFLFTKCSHAICKMYRILNK